MYSRSIEQCGMRVEALSSSMLSDSTCAGLDSVTQVFSVISSCIVDVAVSRCALRIHVPMSFT